MVGRILFRQWRKMLMIAVTVALGVSLATAMLNVLLDVGDKVNRELKTYGANITVRPRGASLLRELYGVEEESGAMAQYLREEDLGKIKTIFWAFNIVDFAPFLETEVRIGTEDAPVKLTGTWFHKRLELPTGEVVETGMSPMKSWWDITEGEWPGGEEESALAGKSLAERLGIKPGDSVFVRGKDGAGRTLLIKGIFHAGSEEDEGLFAQISLVQALTGRPGAVGSVEVSALTTPDNELSRRAARNPKSLSSKEWETWYCTAYVSAICYQIEEVIPDSVAKPLRQVAESEGAILEKIRLLMLLVTVLSLLGSALGISNLVTASVMERSREIGLLKAMGAQNSAVSLLFLAGILITALLGGLAGYLAGLVFAQIIGRSVFGSGIDAKPMVLPLVAILTLLVTLGGSLPSVRRLLSLRPAEVLHDR
jgi:putative ABC transport system permease protein